MKKIEKIFDWLIMLNGLVIMFIGLGIFVGFPISAMVTFIAFILIIKGEFENE